MGQLQSAISAQDKVGEWIQYNMELIKTLAQSSDVHQSTGGLLISQILFDNPSATLLAMLIDTLNIVSVKDQSAKTYSMSCTLVDEAISLLAKSTAALNNIDHSDAISLGKGQNDPSSSLLPSTDLVGRNDERSTPVALPKV